jgi:PleD family two-component response regulator
VSIGLTTGPLTGDNMETLLQRADMVMYRAKNAGRNRSFTYADHAADISAGTSAVG